MAVKQKVERVFPPGYTNAGIGKINEYLLDGWIVKFITPVKTDQGGGIIHDYVIEKNTEE